jgi:hypothetical protein
VIRAARALPLLLLAPLAAGCLEESPAGIFARFLSDREIPGEADTLEVVVLAAAGDAELHRSEHDLAPIGAFPATIGLVAGPGTPAAIRVEGRLSLAGELVAEGAADATLAAGKTRDLDVVLVDVQPLDL